MLSAERERQPGRDRLRHCLGPTARRLLRQVEQATGSPAIVRRVPPDILGTYAQIAYGSAGQPHVISMAEGATPFLDYLVGHECGHALRLFGVPENERLMAFIEEEHLRRSARSLVPEIQRCWGGALGAQARELAVMYHRGLVGQVVNFPSDLRIETWLKDRHPALRSLQELALRANIAELQFGLHPEVEAATPPLLFRAEASLNAVYCAYIARLLGDPTLAEPYQRRGFGRTGQELADQIWETRFKDYGQDRRDAEDWAGRFGLSEWFCWRHYRG